MTAPSSGSAKKETGRPSVKATNAGRLILEDWLDEIVAERPYQTTGYISAAVLGAALPIEEQRIRQEVLEEVRERLLSEETILKAGECCLDAEGIVPIGPSAAQGLLEAALDTLSEK